MKTYLLAHVMCFVLSAGCSPTTRKADPQAGKPVKAINYVYKDFDLFTFSGLDSVPENEKTYPFIEKTVRKDTASLRIHLGQNYVIEKTYLRRNGYLLEKKRIVEKPKNLKYRVDQLEYRFFMAGKILEYIVNMDDVKPNFRAIRLYTPANTHTVYTKNYLWFEPRHDLKVNLIADDNVSSSVTEKYISGDKHFTVRTTSEVKFSTFKQRIEDRIFYYKDLPYNSKFSFFWSIYLELVYPFQKETD